MTTVTKHATDRAKERVGLKKSSIKRMAEVALRDGFGQSEASGSFRKYLDSLYFNKKTATVIRVYGGHIYLFATGEILITILHIPHEYRRVVDKIRGRFNDRRDRKRTEDEGL